MKNLFSKGLFLFIAASMFACSPIETVEPEMVVIDKEQIKKEIQAKENEFAEIYNSGEIKNIGYYADDAITYYQNMAPLTSKSERIDFFELDISSNTNRISFTTKDIFVSSDGIQVVEIGYYEVTDSINSPISTGNYMSLFEKRDGKYFCIRDMSASDMPLE